MDRKHFLKLLLAGGGATFLGLGGGTVARAAEKRGPVCPWGRLKFMCASNNDDDWNVHPHGDINLIDHITEKTTLNLDHNWNVAHINQLEDMTRYPFLFMHSELPPELDAAARANLREYFLRGGFLFAEDCVMGKGRAGHSYTNDKFFKRMVDELPLILPEAKFERLPFDHPVFHSFFDINGGIPHMQGTPHGLYGLTLNGRLVALVSPSDTHCGWTGGTKWFGAAKAAAALQMGTNIYLYAMTQGVKGA